ncbi:CotH kinase family protein [Actinotalea sp. M2MS4P-6]|uniref:CotH kinase family protein n=1 Tax=Actinotalea sp. M2MS4P-6 TaxID=2983762 RepID=UPI0021E499DB|nr:CotH kinase family protein [Actinotalea sp. M2MS4P-6]MCV2395483.1 CotH kinase family protein [Actinotalea sp. M2MS4P-6]
MSVRRRASAARAAAVAVVVALALALAGCASSGEASSAATAAPSASATGTAAGSTATTTGFFDTSQLHTIEVELDQADLDDVIATYLATGEKDWLSATVTIDGETFTDVGMRLKGNSTLRVVTADTPGEDLPWLIRLDKYVDGQSLDGVTSLVVRASSTSTAVNEAVALQLIAAAGLASEAPTEVAFSVNGDAALRLVIENPDDVWAARTFTSESLLYKAQAGGDYSYRGDDPAAYDDIFDQEAGEPETLDPLIEFLAWLNESDDATFAAELDEHVDVDSLVTYLAVQELVGNADDIDGPGNNSYLQWDPDTGLMTVVSWDQNLSFGTANVGGQGGPGAGQGAGQAPDRAPGQAAGGAAGQAAGGRPAGGAGPGRGGNVLTERFLSDPDAVAAVDAELDRLTAELVTSGVADGLLDDWQTLLTDQAGDLVDAATVAAEVDAVRAALD